jgi:putative RecB family exonuclease
VIDRYEELWHQLWDESVAIVRSGRTAEEYLVEGRQMLSAFHNGVLQRDRSETLALEQRFTLRLTDDVVFTGFADRVGRTSKGRLFVVDYKTARTIGDASEHSEGLQAPLYASCALRIHNEEVAVAGYHYLRHDTTSWHRVDASRSREILSRFVALARAAAAADDHRPRPGALCAWCGFNSICPSAQVREELSGGLHLGLGSAAESTDP